MKKSLILFIIVLISGPLFTALFLYKKATSFRVPFYESCVANAENNDLAEDQCHCMMEVIADNKGIAYRKGIKATVIELVGGAESYRSDVVSRADRGNADSKEALEVLTVATRYCSPDFEEKENDSIN